MKTTHPTHRVRSSNCPNASPASAGSGTFGICSGCAWGFLDPTHAQPVPEELQQTPLGYDSDCGSVLVVVATVNEQPVLGALRSNKFWPAIAGNTAVTVFEKKHGDVLRDFGITPKAIAA